MGFAENRIEANLYMGVSKNNGIPKWMVKIRENPMNKWMILGVPLFLETPIYFEGFLFVYFLSTTRYLYTMSL